MITGIICGEKEAGGKRFALAGISVLRKHKPREEAQKSAQLPHK